MVHSYQRFHGNQNGTKKRHTQAICFLGPCRMPKYSVLYCEQKCTWNYAGPALSHPLLLHMSPVPPSAPLATFVTVAPRVPSATTAPYESCVTPAS